MNFRLSLQTTPSVKPKRRQTQRSRTGCLTCRIRRVKCGEEKPCCLRCTHTGRKCDGYSIKKTPNSIPSPSPSGVPYGYELTRVSPKSPLTVSWTSLPGSMQEQQLFDFFRCKSIADLAGFSGTGLWGLALQVMHEEPALRHAAISLAALQQVAQNESMSDTDRILGREFALRQCNQAIRYLAHYISKNSNGSGSTDIVLVSCLLFFAFESFQGRFEEAKQHLQSGLNIISSTPKKSKQSYLEEELIGIFVRLGIQGPLFGRLDLPKQLCHNSQSTVPKTDTTEPVFSSFLAARNSLYRILYDGIRWIPTVAPDQSPSHDAAHPTSNTKEPYPSSALVAEQTELLRRLDQWFIAFKPFLHQEKPLAQTDAHEILMLQIHHKFFSIIIGTSIREDEMIYDKFNDDFETVVRLCESLVGAIANTKVSLSLCNDPGLAAPLHFVNVKCRDSRIRRRALHLIEISPIKENMWDNSLLALSGKQVIELEEGTDEDLDSESVSLVNRIQQVPLAKRIFSSYYSIRVRSRFYHGNGR